MSKKSAYVTIAEVAEELAVSESYVRRMIKTGSLKAHQFKADKRGPVRIARTELDRYVEDSVIQAEEHDVELVHIKL